MITVQTNHMFAVQPTAWTNFDEWGADYTPTINGAYRIALAIEEPTTIWRLTSGSPIKWLNVTPDMIETANAVFD
jgi:hypothetical protein